MGLLLGDFAACGRRVTFSAMRKSPMAQATFSCPFGAIHLENRRGTAQDGHWRAHIRPFLSPLAFGHLPLTRGVGPRAPIYGGLNSATKAVNAKARVAQLNGSRSMTAAAERAVTFGSCFYRWTARLLSCLGSSAAQGIGGRVRTPAPTGDLEAVLSLGGGTRATRAPSSVWPNGQPPYPFWPSAISP